MSVNNHMVMPKVSRYVLYICIVSIAGATWVNAHVEDVYTQVQRLRNGFFGLLTYFKLMQSKRNHW